MEIPMTMQALPYSYSPVTSRIAALARKAGLRVIEYVRAFQNRRSMDMLAGLDERMLRDIGLTRGDVRDAFAEPLWRDPTGVLVKRVRERRGARLRSISGGGAPAAAAPPLAPVPDESAQLFPARRRYY
jgi:uncharacterized protein YjiS (DUF1127 family)